MAKRRMLQVSACLLIGLGSGSNLRAQYELKSGVYNRLSQRVPANNTGKIAPVGPDGTPTGDPVITPQYSNVRTPYFCEVAVTLEAGSRAGSAGVELTGAVWPTRR